MKKLKTFFYSLKNSISSPKYYEDIVKAKTKFSVKYYLMLSLLLSTVLTLAISIVVIPTTKKFLVDFSGNLKNSYPEDLTVTFKEGKWDVNKEEPVLIPVPERVISQFPSDESVKIPSNIIVIDRKGTINDLDELNTFSLMNEENIIYKEQDGKVVAYPINQVPDTELTKENVDSFIDDLFQYIKNLPYFLPIIILVTLFIFKYVIGGFFTILWVGFVVFIASFIIKKKLSYEAAFRIVTHAITIPFIIQILISGINFVFGLKIPNDWFGFLTLGVSLFFFAKMGDVSLEKEEEPKKLGQ
jgi:hypothetical protein